MLESMSRVMIVRRKECSPAASPSILQPLPKCVPDIFRHGIDPHNGFGPEIDGRPGDEIARKIHVLKIVMEILDRTAMLRLARLPYTRPTFAPRANATEIAPFRIGEENATAAAIAGLHDVRLELARNPRKRCEREAFLDFDEHLCIFGMRLIGSELPEEGDATHTFEAGGSVDECQDGCDQFGALIRKRRRLKDALFPDRLDVVFGQPFDNGLALNALLEIAPRVT